MLMIWSHFQVKRVLFMKGGQNKFLFKLFINPFKCKFAHGIESDNLCKDGFTRHLHRISFCSCFMNRAQCLLYVKCFTHMGCIPACKMLIWQDGYSFVHSNNCKNIPVTRSFILFALMLCIQSTSSTLKKICIQNNTLIYVQNWKKPNCVWHLY